MSDRLFSSSAEEASTIARHQNGSNDRGSDIMSNTRRKQPPPPPSRNNSTIESVPPTIMEHSHLKQQHQQQQQQQQLRPPPPPPRMDKRPAVANGSEKSNDNNTSTTTTYNDKSNNSKDVIVDLTFSPPVDLTSSPPLGEEEKVEDDCLPPPQSTTKKERLRRTRPRNNDGDDDDDDNSVIELNSSSSSSRRTKKRSRTTAGSTRTKHDNIATANNINDEELYEVERIVAHRTIIDNNNNNPVVVYKTRWKGWSTTDDTWEPSQNVARTGHIDKYERNKLQKQLIVGSPGVAIVQYEDGEKEIVNMTNEIFRTHHPNNNFDDEEEEDANNKSLEIIEKGGMRDYNLISTGKWIDILWKHAKIYFPCKIITWTPPLLSTTTTTKSTMSITTTKIDSQQQHSTSQINSNKGRTTIAADNALVANKGKRQQQQQQRHDNSPKWLSTSRSSSLHATAGVTSSSGRGFLLPTTTATSKPSSSSSLSLLPSSREAQVLERQRRVASLLGGGAAANDQRHGTIHLDDAADNDDDDDNNAMTTTSIEYAGTLKPNDVAETLARARQKRQQASSSSSSSSSNNNNESSLSSSSQKRPSMMRGSSNSSVMSTTAAAASVKSTSTFTNKGSLASILLSNTSTAKYMQPNGPTKLLKHYEKVVPDDYWKNMTSWDILGELNDRMMSSTKTITTTTMMTTHDKNNNGLKQQQSSTTTTTTTPLPDVFESYREYCALWAPLLLEEARAQLLSEIISDIPYWKKAKIEKGPVRVFLEPNKADLNSSLDIISVRVKNVLSNSNEYKERSFMVHDIVLLMREESFIWDAYDGKLLLPQKQQQQGKAAAVRQPTRFGIVGYIEYGRRSIEGLTIHVSKDLWSNIGKSEMVLIKLGCNITSLREFTALCRMDSIPLSEYILGAKMSSKNTTMGGGMAKLKRKNTVDTLSDEHLEKKDILSMMGGSSALGKGFAEYVSQKFNLSQLSAISASAQDYGNGGFTLIKGPPGTGKVSINII
jgi:hypothetical protein